MSELDNCLDDGFDALLDAGADEAHIEMADGNSLRVSVLFDEPSAIEVDGEPAMMFSPYLLARTIEVEPARRGDSVHVIKRHFQITTVKPDGRGVSKIELAETTE